MIRKQRFVKAPLQSLHITTAPPPSTGVQTLQHLNFSHIIDSIWPITVMDAAGDLEKKIEKLKRSNPTPWKQDRKQNLNNPNKNVLLGKSCI